MGYSTAYEISWTNNGPTGSLDVPYYSFSNGDTLYEKWYNHDSDMKLLSSKYPDVVFTLRGNGEEAPDFWENTYVAGERTVSKVGQVVLVEVQRNDTGSLQNQITKKFNAALANGKTPQEALGNVFSELGWVEW